MFFFIFNDAATTEIYTLSLHDALPIFFIIHGDSGDGITDEPITQEWSQATPGINGAPEAGDSFAYSLAVGDFDGDGNDDGPPGNPPAR